MDEKDKEIPITETLDGFDQSALVEVDHKYVDSIDVDGEGNVGVLEKNVEVEKVLGEGSVDHKDSKNENKDENVDKNTFPIGTFVWGKTKNDPWWPGRIYDPLDASDFALKHKHDGRFLVAYFGKCSFAWCDPSEMRPFEENFEEISKQSVSSTFVDAVKEAESEFSTIVKLQLTCSCVRAKESESSLRFVVNSGVKEGVYVHKNGNSVHSLDRFNSSALLADIRSLATFSHLSNELERAVLKSLLSAFFHKFGRSLPIHCVHMGIEDPMDTGGVPSEGSFQGLGNRDSSIGIEGRNPVNIGRPRTPLDDPQGGRKTRSIAELLRVLDKGKPVVKSSKKRQNLSDESSSSMHEVDCCKSRARKLKEKMKPLEVAEDGSEAKKQQKKDMAAKLSKRRTSLRINDGSMAEEGSGKISTRKKKLGKFLLDPYTLPLTEIITGLENESTSSEASCSKSDNTIHDTSESIGFLNRLLHGIRSVACDPLSIKTDKFLKSNKEFLSSYRSSTFIKGSEYSSYEKKRARIKPVTKHRLDRKVLNEVAQRTPKSTPVKRSATDKEPMSNSKDVIEVSSSPSSSSTVSVSKRKKMKSSSATRGVKSSDKPLTVKPESAPSTVAFIKQKLESMTSMVPQTDDMLTLEVKSTLENTLKEVLKKLKTMGDVHSSS
ncbi:PWWP domain-containing protein 3-like [Amaranthus tricolor]|uniref:PWWP domain-containing protein 3-like n=1 Tax=Amaranthus tricolor TaxID=29722 RepID=UPI00258EE5FB|nr:PWWP domain-containing protein 3-like [Amaranthus tricolor]